MWTYTNANGHTDPHANGHANANGHTHATPDAHTASARHTATAAHTVRHEGRAPGHRITDEIIANTQSYWRRVPGAAVALSRTSGISTFGKHGPLEPIHRIPVSHCHVTRDI